MCENTKEIAKKMSSPLLIASRRQGVIERGVVLSEGEKGGRRGRARANESAGLGVNRQEMECEIPVLAIGI
jgi:hypothetical protein